MFHRGTDNALYTSPRPPGNADALNWGGTNPAFSNWTSLGGQLSSSPGAASLTDHAGMAAGYVVGERHGDGQYRFRRFGVLAVPNTEWTTEP